MKREPMWVNPDGYDCDPYTYVRPLKWWIRRKMIYSLSLEMNGTLTFINSKGAWRMGKELTHTKKMTDLGSVPIWLRRFWPESQYERAYVYHDYLCDCGGLFWFDTDEAEWFWVEITRADADKMLVEMIWAEQKHMGKPVNGVEQVIDRACIYRGVRIGSLFAKEPDSSSVEIW